MPNPTGNSRITFRQMSMEMEREKEEQKRDKFRNITVSHTDCFSYIANPKESEKKVQEPKAMGGKKIKIRYGIKKAAGIDLRFFLIGKTVLRKNAVSFIIFWYSILKENL